MSDISVGDLVSWCGEYYRIQNLANTNDGCQLIMVVCWEWKQGIVIERYEKSVIVIDCLSNLYEIGKRPNNEDLSIDIKIESRIKGTKNKLQF
tara:strand:- start:372 stop:650 length:279 start_codon:yes stop_codon:yes gene_type:complete